MNSSSSSELGPQRESSKHRLSSEPVGTLDLRLQSLGELGSSNGMLTRRDSRRESQSSLMSVGTTAR